MKAPFYTLPELLEKANALRERIPELADTPAFTERTVYYYVQQRLLPRRAGQRGPGTRYPEAFLHRLLFIRRLQKEKALSLAHIREALHRVPPDTIRAVALGEEPLEIADPTELKPDELDAYLSRHRDAVCLDRPPPSATGKFKMEGKIVREIAVPGEDIPTPVEEKAFDIPMIADMESTGQAVPETRSQASPDRILPLGPGVRIVLDQPPSPRQARLLCNLAPLVQEILADHGDGSTEEDD